MSASMSMSMASAILTGSTFLLSTPRLKPTLLSTKSPLLLLLRSRSVHHHLQSLFGLAAAPRALCQAILTVLVMLGPFCQRVLLTLKEKHLPYDMKLGDLSNKQDCDSKSFSTIIGFLKSIDPNDGTEQALLNELKSFDDYIKENGVFINGDKISAADLSPAPKLYHLEIALRHYKNWSIPESLPYVKMKLVFSMDSFVQSKALPEDVIAGWRPKDFP